MTATLAQEVTIETIMSESLLNNITDFITKKNEEASEMREELSGGL